MFSAVWGHLLRVLWLPAAALPLVHLLLFPRPPTLDGQVQEGETHPARLASPGLTSSGSRVCERHRAKHRNGPRRPGRSLGEQKGWEQKGHHGTLAALGRSPLPGCSFCPGRVCSGRLHITLPPSEKQAQEGDLAQRSVKQEAIFSPGKRTRWTEALAEHPR